jgi:ankyrin repeat protein
MTATLLVAAFALGMARAAEIHEAAQADDIVRIEALLATNKSLVNLTGQDELTPLHLAARAGKIKAVTVLFDQGAEVNALDVHGCTPLHSAVYGQHTLVAEFLLEHGAKVNAARIDEGTTPLYFAADLGDTNLVSLLLKHGARPAAASRTGATPLHAAALAGRLAVVEMLVAAGASVRAIDQDGQTPLHAAAKLGRRDVVEWLLNHGGDADAKDRTGSRPVDYVTGPTSEALMSLLSQRMKSGPGQLPTKVGEAGDPDRLVFEGLQTFTSDQIHHALAVKPRYLLVAHPQADLRVFLKELKSMVQAGYQAAGFPDARADVNYDTNTFRVRVKVTEGSRFKSGELRVVGVKASSREALVRWFTTAAPRSVPEDETRARPGMNTPGKAERPEDPMWVAGEPADFSEVWLTKAVGQVEACLAEQGFFFPQAKVELQRDLAAGAASLLITLQSEGPSGVVGKINVSGTQLHAPGDIIGFLQLREGMKITGEILAAAESKLRDCGRFWDFEITPEYEGTNAVSSRRVNLHITVKEQEGVPRLDKPLTPAQQALVRLCEWLEQFPSRDEDIQVTVSNQSGGFPIAASFIVSPKRGLLLNSADLQGASPISAGFLLAEDSIQFSAWTSGSKVAAAREGGGRFFLRVLPDKGGTNHFSFTVGANYSGKKGPAGVKPPLLDFDVQLSRAAFLDLLTRGGCAGRLDGDQLVVTNDAFMLRAEAATGRLIEVDCDAFEPSISLRFGLHVWDEASRDFTRRAAPLTNLYAPGRGIASLLSLAASEVVRGWLAVSTNSSVNPEQRARASAAVRKLLNPEFLLPVDQFFGGEETNTFGVPVDDLDLAMAQNSVAALFGGMAFNLSGQLFPKYSWPWTVARESSFVMLGQGRYTDVELERLYKSEDIGPIGLLTISRLLGMAGSSASRDFALQGLIRLGSEDFLRDCNLFLRGDSGLARSFARLAEVLRTLPDDELAALVAVLPGAEANLVRDAAAALRSQPEASPASVLAPAFEKYWQETLRAKVRESLRQLSLPSRESGKVSI